MKDTRSHLDARSADRLPSGYRDDALEQWADRVRAWAGTGRDVYVYFDNDVKVHAPFDAQRLASLLGVGPTS